MRVVFAGTPEAALPALDAVAGSRHDLVGVVTRPDAPAGRGRRLTPSPVARRADELGVPVLKPEHPRDPEFQESLRALTPWLRVETHAAVADEALLDALLPSHQLVLDCTDNVAIRNLLNRRARAHRVPLVSGAAIRLEGQLCSFTWQADEPCYACLSALFGDQALTCVEAGVLAPVVGLVGSLQALEAIKLLAGMGKSYSGRLLMIDGLQGGFREMKLPKRPDCPVCSKP